MIFYSISYSYLLNTVTFTSQRFGITSSLDSFSALYGNCDDFDVAQQIRTPDVGGASRFNKTFSNIISVPGTTSNIRLTVALIYTPIGENVSVTGTMKLMRIG